LTKTPFHIFKEWLNSHPRCWLAVWHSLLVRQLFALGLLRHGMRGVCQWQARVVPVLVVEVQPA
jgi:hypothetical protein